MKIAAVVVTFNRLEKLKKALASYENQISPISDLIVVNNCSTDGTEDFLKGWANESGVFNRHVINEADNMGGSGGFHDGCEFALSLNPDWVLVADDDAYLAEDAVLVFETFVNDNPDRMFSAVCSSVIRMNGEYVLDHRRNDVVSFGLRPRFKKSELSDYQKEFFKINTFSYVGAFMRASALRKVGLCNRDYFIYFDDSEHSMRMAGVGDIICVPQIQVFHDDGFTKEKQASNQSLSWRDYYCIRNMVYSYLIHHKAAGIYLIVYDLICSAFSGKKKRKLVFDAIRDAINGRLGKHNLYAPGKF